MSAHHEGDGAQVLLLRRQTHLGRDIHDRQTHAPPRVNRPTGISSNASYMSLITLLSSLLQKLRYFRTC